MEELRARVNADAICAPGGIVVVNSFLNHQVDPVLMQRIGEEFAKRFAHAKASKILTAETSGIVPALATAMVMKIPLVFARKQRPVTMLQTPYVSKTPTHTKGGDEVDLFVAREFLHIEDRILIVDDFLATALTIKALCDIVDQSGATLVGIGAVIEKCYEHGRTHLRAIDVPIESLVQIESVATGEIVFRN
jgi:xanthine phosphoribosyltransferase